MLKGFVTPARSETGIKCYSMMQWGFRRLVTHQRLIYSLKMKTATSVGHNEAFKTSRSNCVVLCADFFKLLNKLCCVTDLQLWSY